jgi:hypothetical protein
MLKNFTVPDMPPVLVNGIGYLPEIDAFVKRFGSGWKRTPVKGVYYIGDDVVQFTLRAADNDLAAYLFDSIKEFKDVFANHKATLAANAIYYNSHYNEPLAEQSCTSVIKFLNKLGK